MNSEPTSSMPAGGSSQKLQLFMRANAMSGAPISSGIIQLAKPDGARHDRAEHHDEAVQRGHRVEELGIDDLQSRA